MKYEETLLELLCQVSNGTVEPADALDRLRTLPFSDLGFAKVDHHRELRQGFAEVVFCQGKTPAQAAAIASRLLLNNNGNLLLTRAGPEHAERILKIDSRAVFHPVARAITIEREPVRSRGLVSVVTAGTADIPVAEEAVVTARMMGAAVDTYYDVGVAGVHRVFHFREDLSGSNAVVVVAGMEGALASLVGGIVSCPVVATPTSIGYGASFGGLAALLTMINSCAAGVSVVNIDNGFGAGYLSGLINRIACGEGPSRGRR